MTRWTRSVAMFSLVCPLLAGCSPKEAPEEPRTVHNMDGPCAFFTDAEREELQLREPTEQGGESLIGCIYQRERPDNDLLSIRVILWPRHGVEYTRLLLEESSTPDPHRFGSFMEVADGLYERSEGAFAPVACQMLVGIGDPTAVDTGDGSAVLVEVSFHGRGSRPGCELLRETAPMIPDKLTARPPNGP